MAKRITAQERRRQIRQKKTREYWKKRSEVYNKAMLAKGERYVAEDVADQYKKAMGAIEREISLWYQRFGEGNKLTAAQAKVALNAKEMAELRWTVNDYIKHAEENMLTGEWVAQLRNASAKAHISRMDAIMLNIQQQLEVMFGNQLDGMDKTLKDIYNDGFLHTAFEVDKGFGVATSFDDINMGKLQQVVNKPWVADGLTFSDRIWRDKATLVDELKTQLAQATIRGDDLPTAVKNISGRMDVSRSNAARLVMTESAYFATKAQQDCFNELGVEKVEFVATLDDRTSPECQELDGTVMEAKDAKPGDNAPPMHCWCRSCLAPYFGDNAGKYSKRAARSMDTGKTIEIPTQMNYDEYNFAFIEKGMVQNDFDWVFNNPQNATYANFQMALNLKPPTDEFIEGIAKQDNIPYTKGKQGRDRFFGDADATGYREAIYPRNNGAVGAAKPVLLKAGDIIVDRYGAAIGRFFSPLGTPFEKRSLKYSPDEKVEYTKYKIIRDIWVRQGKIAPWFGYEGGGIQYMVETDLRGKAFADYIKKFFEEVIE